MPYRKITLEVVVAEDIAEAYMQALNDALDRIEEMLSVHLSDIRKEELSELESPESVV